MNSGTARVRPRSPWVAAIIGLLMPGLGHMYAGRPRAAAVISLVLVPLALMLMVAIGLFAPPVLWVLYFPVAALALQVGTAFHAAITARRADPAYTPRVFNRWYYYLATILLWMVGLEGMVRAIRANAQELFRIPSATMAPTLLVGDCILVAKLPISSRTPRLDSLIVFPALDDPRSIFVKRTVGLPGDTLSMRDGVLFRNGQGLGERYALTSAMPELERSQERAMMRGWQTRHLIGRDTAHYAPDYRNWGPLVVSLDSVFVLGDNRALSYDSRHYGFIPIATVQGRPRFIYFSRDSITGIRWRRIGHRIS